MKKFEIITTVENGKFKRNLNAILNAVKSFEGKTINFTMQVARKQRSVSQNSYYWGVIIPIWQNTLLAEWGDHYSKQETHEFLKYNCNYIEKINEQTGEVIRMSKSTTENTTTDQEIFHDRCRKLALEMFNVEIPLPNEQVNFEL
jgi:hypothetical protein